MPWNREDVLPFKVCYVDLPDFSILRTFASHQFRVSSRMITGCVVITHLLCLCAHSCVLVWTFKWNSIKVCHHHTPLCAGELTRCARETHLILECSNGLWYLHFNIYSFRSFGSGFDFETSGLFARRHMQDLRRAFFFSRNRRRHAKAHRRLATKS